MPGPDISRIDEDSPLTPGKPVSTILDAQVPTTKEPVRSIFISDIHLGSRSSRGEEVLEFLRAHQPRHLFLVGDFIDGWALERQWHWPHGYTRLLRRVMQLAESGTQVYYTPGNHDDHLRQRYGRRAGVTIRDEFIHRCADGTRLLVIHGDQFDDVESKARWVSRVGSTFYEAMLWGDRVSEKILRAAGMRPRPISHGLKQTAKMIVQRISGFERRLAALAIARDCDVAVCGHLHRPQQRMIGSVRYINLGDWIENASALLEHADGTLELHFWKTDSTLSLPLAEVSDSVIAAADRLAAELLSDLPFDHPLTRPKANKPIDRVAQRLSGDR
jgi:UDP-2,3-diacylglucosamine pyrophosphatase LpxH